jgi:hypothetical protein
MAYQNDTPFQILEHLNDHWCPLDVKAKKALKDASPEVESKAILMGHPILCCHAPIVRSFFIHCKVIFSP